MCAEVPKHSIKEMLEKAAKKGDTAKVDRIIESQLKLLQDKAIGKGRKPSKMPSFYWDAKAGQHYKPEKGKKWFESDMGKCHDDRHVSLGLHCGSCGIKTTLHPMRVQSSGVVPLYWCTACGYLDKLSTDKNCGHLSHGGHCGKCIVVPKEDKVHEEIKALEARLKQLKGL